jgi:dihydrofolate reductase
MIISLIAAIGKNLVIGDERGMPWHVPHDLKRFKSLTWGKPIIMGRRTFEILGRPLPGRPNIILTRDQSFRPEGAHVAYTPHGALGLAEMLLRDSDDDEVMIVGGEQVYQAFAAWAQRLYLSLIDGEYSGTAHFPDRLPCLPAWNLRARERSQAGGGAASYTFFFLERSEPRLEPTASLLGKILFGQTG